MFALALAAISAGGGILTWAFDSPDAGAVVLASSAPGVLVGLYEVMRALDGPADEATRRSCRLALVLLIVPFTTLIALAARLFERVPWKLVP